MGQLNYSRCITSSSQVVNLERVRCVEDLVANMRLIGLEPLPEYFVLANRYVADELTPDQFAAAVDGLCRNRCNVNLEAGQPPPLQRVPEP